MTIIDEPTGEYTEFKTFTDFGIFDGDQHIYEPWDCLDEHIEPAYAERTIHTAHDADGKLIVLADGKPFPMDNQPGRVTRPGSLKERLRKMKIAPHEEGAYQYMSIDPAFNQRDERIALLDKQNVATAVLFPGSIGLMSEYALTDDDLYYATSWAYLRWFDQYWGFNAGNRTLFAPVLSMRDPQRTGEQIDWLIEHGCRMVTFCTGPAYGRSPGDTFFDPIWSRLNDGGVVVAYHINDGMRGFKAERSRAWGEEEFPTHMTQSAWQWAWAYGEQPAMETFSSMIYANLFERFPNLKILSAEHGAEWVPGFMRRIDKMRGMGRNGRWLNGQLKERPSEIFKRHFRVVPYWEDDLMHVIEELNGLEVIIGGSDFPHSEGLAFPTQLVEHLRQLSPDEQRFVMRDNGMRLVGFE